ncbi:ankyrin repeat and KH domain-containing protein mask-like [Culex pipiens pallens]|uniref:ankyrin repeat and KH domain-containing protein mask-like n=1 Tax=Culex pipiens pallens TaxID=42434 RepID=UPI0022AA955B|nr:ankyrin repeat and KH domain-containing protein mask-like [Culex pipiens pallens]
MPTKKKNRLAGVRQAPVDQQSAAAVAAVPGGYQFEAFPAPAPIQNTAGNVVQERQIDVDSETDSNHDTALPQACAGGNEELVELLISRGTNIEHKDKKGFTPLILAATAGHEKVVVETLLRHGAKMDLDLEKSREESRKASKAKSNRQPDDDSVEEIVNVRLPQTSGRGNSTTPATNNRIHPREPPPTASIVVQQQQDKEEFGESGIDANSQGSCSSSDVKSASSLIEQKRKNNKKRKQQLQQAHQQQQQSHVSSAVTAKQLQQQQYACGRTIRAASVHLRQVFSRPVLLQGHIRTHTG